MTSKNAIVDICKYIVDVHNDIFSSHNVFLDIQNYILDIWNSFSFWISEMKIMTSNNWIEDICNGSFS